MLRWEEEESPRRVVGVLLDAGAMHPGRRGREVLVLAAKTMGVPVSRVDEVLELVKLTGRPESIFWMRGLLRDFADRGGTVLLSSHLLNEVEAVADRLVVIGRGRIAAAGSREALLASTAGGLGVTSLDDATLTTALQAEGITVTATGQGLVVDADPEVVGRAALGAGVVLTGLAPSAGHGLEELFFAMTAGTGLGTFALVPRRQRGLAAKLGAVLVLTVLAFVFSAVTTVLPLLFFLVARLRDVGPWVDYSTALQRFSAGELASGTQWLQVATASAIWVLLPAAVGAWRVQRAETT